MADETTVVPDAAKGVEPPAPSTVNGTQPQPSHLDSLKEVLSAHKIQSPEDITGLVSELQDYKRKYGDSQNMVGALRRELNEFKNQMKAATHKQEDSQDFMGNPVDLEKSIENSIHKVFGKIQAQQNEAQKAYYTQRALLEQEPDWKHVQPHMDKALESPVIREALQTGQMTMKELYLTLSNKYLLAAMTKSIAEFEKVKGHVKPQDSIGDTSSRVPIEPEADEKKKQRLKKAKESKDMKGILDALIPANDPILRY